MSKGYVNWNDALFAEVDAEVGDNYVSVAITLPSGKGHFQAISGSFTHALCQIFKKANFTDEAKVELARRVERKFCVHLLSRGARLGDQ